MIYYNYTIVRYSTYFTYFSQYFITLYSEGQQLQKSNFTTSLLIGCICGGIAFVFIVVGLIIFLVHHQRGKIRTDTSKEEEEINNINEIETILPIPNIENDPFEKDFQEDNIIKHL